MRINLCSLSFIVCSPDSRCDLELVLLANHIKVNNEQRNSVQVTAELVSAPVVLKMMLPSWLFLLCNRAVFMQCGLSHIWLFTSSTVYFNFSRLAFGSQRHHIGFSNIRTTNWACILSCTDSSSRFSSFNVICFYYGRSRSVNSEYSSQYH